MQKFLPTDQIDDRDFHRALQHAVEDEFVIEVAGLAQTAHHSLCSELTRPLHQGPMKLAGTDASRIETLFENRLFDQQGAFCPIEQALLFRILSDTHFNDIEKRKSLPYDVEMSARRWIEGTGVETDRLLDGLGLGLDRFTGHCRDIIHSTNHSLISIQGQEST